MARRDILVYPDPRLKRVAAAVEHFDGRLRELLADLEETMLAGPGAVGIAAPQLGCAQRVVLVDASLGKRRPASCHGRLVLINPEITAREGEVIGREGCLSVPDYTGNVMRAARIRVGAQDAEGRSHDYEFEGFEARLVQHELDHLDGLLFLDRLVSRRSDLFRRK